MRTLLLMFFSFFFLFSLQANDIDTLLQSYEKESDLSNKTKDESAGNLIVYTRDDLERMQVESLRDILKSLRLFGYAENRLGQSDILNADPLSYYSKSIRIYLNDNELLTSIAGSGLITFGDMEMDFIDHVEVYEGFPSLDIGIEPATVVIRLYTKSPEHDEGGRVRVMLGSYGTNKENVYYTNKENGLSYFMYANNTDSKKDTYTKDGQTIRRDEQTKRFYGSLASQQHEFSFHAMQTDGDAFLGSLVGNVADKTYTKTSFFNATLNSKFMNDTLKVNLSYIDGVSDFAYRYDTANPVIIPIDAAPFFASITSLEQTIDEEAFTASIKKELDMQEQDISFGIQYRYKHFDLTDVKFSIPTDPISQAYYKEEIYSFFLQDLISINENNMLTLSVVHQMYKRDGEVNSPDTTQFRFGYIYTDDIWVAKTFISMQEFASEPYMTISPHYGNSELEPESYESIFQEFNHKYKNLESKLILGYGKNKKIPILDENFIIQNSKNEIEAASVALEFTYLFNENDKLDLQTSYTNVDSPNDGSPMERYHGTIRMLNSINKFDIFNELVMHGGYDNVSTGYDYSFGIKYAFSKDLHINFKGENVFNSGLKKSYVTKATPVVERVTVPIVERSFLFGLEYLF